jgi:hypothetical protein
MSARGQSIRWARLELVELRPTFAGRACSHRKSSSNNHERPHHWEQQRRDDLKHEDAVTIRCLEGITRLRCVPGVESDSTPTRGVFFHRRSHCKLVRNTAMSADDGAGGLGRTRIEGGVGVATVS